MHERPGPQALIERVQEEGRLDPLAEQVDRVSGVLGEGDSYAAMRGDWLGHALHPAMTDLPIGFWTSAAVLDIVGGRSARRAAQRLIALGLLSVPVTAVTGLADYRSVPDRAAMRVGAVHAAANTIAALLYAESWRRRRKRRHASAVLVGMLGGGVASFSAYLGGHLSFARGTGTGERGVGQRRAPAELG